MSAFWAVCSGCGVRYFVGPPLVSGRDCLCVPHEPPHEDLDERADRDEAAGWGR